MALASSCTDTCSQAAFGKDALESAHELATRILERLEDRAKEREHFVVARLPSPHETLVDGIKLFGFQSTRLPRGLIEDQPHGARHL